jgi:4-alpha-glucanotransferase
MNILAQAKDLGIQAEFTDGQGRQRVTDQAALRIILDALPPRKQCRFLGGPVVIRSGRSSRTELDRAAVCPVSWKIVAAQKLIAEGKTTEHTIFWPEDLPLGAYRLQVSDRSGEIEEVPLIVAPKRAFGGDFNRGWLLAVQLYGIRSVRNWGIGDFTDVQALIELANHLGADGVGMNPLHVLFDDKPSDCSPYSPNSRLFLNPLYIDIGKIPEFSHEDCTEVEETTPRLRQSPVVDYAAVADLKWRGLRCAFEHFAAKKNRARRQEFSDYRAERGTLLVRFAAFEVLRHRFNKPWWE